MEKHHSPGKQTEHFTARATGMSGDVFGWKYSTEHVVILVEVTHSSFLYLS